MVQNLKVDVIYHQTASDFEMEFNLCGCCRMRLLNDKTTDKKGFVRALARSVSRSRVIIVCGPLFGDEGIISTVSAAIGSGLTVCDNKTYGINSSDTIKIINDSTPLVTLDGYFGGCIIESGPQTIILLTENRAFRKTIMQNLIHPYIEEISYIPTKSVQAERSAAEKVEPVQAQVTEAETYITEVDTDYGEEETVEVSSADVQTADKHNIEFIMDGAETADEEPLPQAKDDTDFGNMYIEVEKPAEIKARYEQSYTPSKEDEMFITAPEYEEPKSDSKPQSRAVDISIVILVLVLLMAVLALVYFVFLLPYTRGISTGDYLKEIFSVSSNNSLGV